jgi:hypothetical protein
MKLEEGLKHSRQYRCMQIADPFIHNNTSSHCFFLSSSIHVKIVYCVSLLTLLSSQPLVRPPFTHSISVIMMSATSIFRSPHISQVQKWHALIVKVIAIVM